MIDAYATRPDLEGKRILIMGLGAHGGGAASARYCADHGAQVTVTDFRTEKDLSESLNSLDGLSIDFRLGEHLEADFERADIVIKNPAVPRTSRFLQIAKRVETDISLFLATHRGSIAAITGTKGKSSTASALHHLVVSKWPDARLGGNITISPLEFLDSLSGDEIVVLELSSFQLGDLLLTTCWKENRCRPFTVAVITNLLPDHQDYYRSMEEYAADKGVIFSRLSPDGHALIASQDEYCKGYRPPEEQTIRISEDSAGHSESRPDSSESVLLREHAILPDSLLVGGAHMRKNLFTAGVAAFLMGMTEQEIRSAAATYRGIPHRLEPVAEIDGVLFVNDSAATIQEASRAAVQSFNRPVHLICGGSEKGLPLDLFKQISKEAATVTLLTGSATSQIEKHLRAARTTYAGPFGSLPEAVDHTRASARAGDVVLLSPGCASFGMFQNEFDRGDQFRTIVRSYEQ